MTERDAARIDAVADVSDAALLDAASDTPRLDAAMDVLPDAIADATPPDSAGRTCPEPPACDATPPDPGPTAPWNHPIATRWTISQGSARHRGRDLFLREGDEQWAIAKFAYGPADDDLNDEDVDIYLLRDCRTWEMLGQARTTDDDNPPHPTVEGVDDRGGRVYFRIPNERRLGVGWHRIRFVVRGDHTSAEQYINVLPAGARVAVSDVDGTLTESENAEFAAIFGGASPMVNPGAPEALWTLARRGYHIFYLTARPEWLETRTHEWIVERGLPPGIVHTTLGLTGATGSSAQSFKTAELMALIARLGYPPDWAFGNTDSDAQAYAAAGIDPRHRFLYRYTGDTHGGTNLEDYGTLVAPFSMLPAVCP